MKLPKITLLGLMLGLVLIFSWPLRPRPVPDFELVHVPLTSPSPEAAAESAALPGSLKAALAAAVHTDTPAGTTGGHPYHLLKFVSTGKYTTLTLPDGSQALAALAYTVNTYSEILTIPVALGYTLPEGTSYAFSIYQYGQAAAEADLIQLKQTLPRGQVFSAQLFDFVRANQVDWQRCPSYVFPGSPTCQSALELQNKYPGVEASLLSGTLRSAPVGWLLFGWGLAPAEPENALIWRVELPEEGHR